MRAQEVSLPSTTCVYSASGRNQLAAMQMAAVKSLLHQHRYHLSTGLPHICVSTFAAWGGPKIQRHRHGHSQHMRRIWQAFATSNAKCRSLCPSPQEESKRGQSEYLTNQPVRSERTSTIRASSKVLQVPVCAYMHVLPKAKLIGTALHKHGRNFPSKSLANLSQLQLRMPHQKLNQENWNGLSGAMACVSFMVMFSCCCAHELIVVFLRV